MQGASDHEAFVIRVLHLLPKRSPTKAAQHEIRGSPCRSGGGGIAKKLTMPGAVILETVSSAKSKMLEYPDLSLPTLQANT